ncbi:hypothetical protein DCAR_0310635 [Daucus carota subsp. sativus]|uniref:LysM domain-containing protein n=1 Tax=Daucus carota subsp. sativus TaxID=79200 RepID=A0A162AGQ0_DAUCS|nr:PREDICTED: uncharacterized protein LOC108213823 [Daucus carota subsp. sativus]WOG91386.1 hypothetical protein DCAR_0310635 [Daucus carota subsp. sativus]
MATTVVPSFSYKSKKRLIIAVADEVSLYCAIALVVLFLLAFVRQIDSAGSNDQEQEAINAFLGDEEDCRQHDHQRRLCDEIYVVEQGETLQTISNKCRDSFIVERNPHIHDPDDVFPGLLIKIIPDSNSLIGSSDRQPSRFSLVRFRFNSIALKR